MAATKYKDSGIPWIGMIPSDWSSDLIGNLYTLRNEKVSDKDYPPLSVGKMGVVPQLETAAKTDDGDNRKLVRVGDFAINSRSDRRGSCGISNYDGSVSLINTILTPRGEMNPKYFNWFFHTEQFADEFYKWGHGIVDDLWTTRWQEMKRIAISVPPLPTQQRIADFLDRKCAEIDELAALQETMIAELKRYKQSVITEAVTKGLDPDVPMKDSASRAQNGACTNSAEAQPVLERKFKHSGVEWIGEIPEGWSVCRLKDKYTFKTGTTPKDFDKITDDGNTVNWFTPIDIDEECNVLFTATRKLHTSIIEKEKIELYPIGSLIFVGIGASAGKIGFAQVQGYSNQQITALISFTNICSKYTFYFLIADRKRIRDNAFFTTLPIINNGYLSTIQILLPPLAEQRAIADYLDRKCAEIEELIAIKQQKIEALKEYKKSVIFEYVTGKKEI